MANYFGRRTLRIQNVPEQFGRKVVSSLRNEINVEKTKVLSNSICIYIPSQLKNFVQKKTLKILNGLEGIQRLYGYGDLEFKSTIVVITNIPEELDGSHMDSLMKDYGKTLTRFQFIKLGRIRDAKTKFGWVVFEDLHDAEKCEKETNGMKLRDNYLSSTILPDDIISESSLHELKTIQFEGFPQHYNEEKIKQIVHIVIPEWPIALILYIKTKTIVDSHSRTRYIALLDWSTNPAAFAGLKKLNNFKTSLQGDVFMHIKAYFALPGITALSEFRASSRSNNNDCESTYSETTRPLINNNIFRKSPPPYSEVGPPIVRPRFNAHQPPSYSEATRGGILPQPFFTEQDVPPPIPPRLPTTPNFNHMNINPMRFITPPPGFVHQHNALLALAAQQHRNQLNAIQQLQALNRIPPPTPLMGNSPLPIPTPLMPLMTCRPAVPPYMVNNYCQQTQRNNINNTGRNMDTIHIADASSRSRSSSAPYEGSLFDVVNVTSQPGKSIVNTPLISTRSNLVTIPLSARAKSVISSSNPNDKSSSVTTSKDLNNAVVNKNEKEESTNENLTSADSLVTSITETAVENTDSLLSTSTKKISLNTPIRQKDFNTSNSQGTLDTPNIKAPLDTSTNDGTGWSKVKPSKRWSATKKVKTKEEKINVNSLRTIKSTENSAAENQSMLQVPATVEKPSPSNKNMLRRFAHADKPVNSAQNTLHTCTSSEKQTASNRKTTSDCDTPRTEKPINRYENKFRTFAPANQQTYRNETPFRTYRTFAPQHRRKKHREERNYLIASRVVKDEMPSAENKPVKKCVALKYTTIPSAHVLDSIIKLDDDELASDDDKLASGSNPPNYEKLMYVRDEDHVCYSQMFGPKQYGTPKHFRKPTAMFSSLLITPLEDVD